MRTFRPRRHHPVVWIVLGTGVLLVADGAAWLLWAAWHVMPLLLAAGVVVLGCRRWGWHLRALAWLRPSVPAAGPVVPGQVVSDDRELFELRARVARFEHAAGRSLDAATASYEHIQRQYGDATVGKPGRQS